MNRRVAGAILVALAIVLALPATSLAGKPWYSKSKLTGSLSYTIVTDRDGDGVADWNDVIRWVPVTTKTSYPNVDLACYQAGVRIYSAHAGYYASYLWPDSQDMTLDSMAWPDGTGATCHAILSYFSVRKTYADAVYDFTVAP